MEPVDALTEIATLLERERASKYRSKAFRSAAAAIDGLTTGELSDRLRSAHIAGVGDTSRAVILQALDGQVPDYLAELRARYAVTESTLRPALRGDLHAHTDWSDGTAGIQAMIDAAVALGHEYQAITDHSPRLRVARGLTAERLASQLDALDQIQAPIRVLRGIEVDILENGELDQTDEMLARLDVVVGSVHSKLRSSREDMTRRMVRAVNSGRMHVLGHVTGRLVTGERGTRPPSELDARAVFAACAEQGVAVEINSRPERADPPDDLIGVALEEGCLFAIDSDAHAPGQLSLLDHGAARAEACGVPAQRIVTTWPIARLEAWLARA
ncbi:PHP domain-containing protein [Microbacterium sp. ZW T5_56]|uniref:PHP domain-containing protein n=1 Tax=Microbacterium sp. ZW T5_56 TaxID=3378081 RepID=UPI003851DB8F